MENSEIQKEKYKGKVACAACRHRRRQCSPNCPYARYFPAEDPGRFARVLKLFGAKKFLSFLDSVPPSRRDEAATTLCYQADMRCRDPVHGCVAVINHLEVQVTELENELAHYQQLLAAYTGHQNNQNPSSSSAFQSEIPQMNTIPMQNQQQQITQEIDQLPDGDPIKELHRAFFDD